MFFFVERKGRLKKVYLVILDTSGTPIERFTLDVRVLVSDFDKESLTEYVSCRLCWMLEEFD